MSFEEKMKQDLKKDLEIPEIVEQKIQDAYKEIGQGKLRMKKPDNRNQKRKKVWTTAAAAVAVIAVSGTVLYSNPVLAKNIPVIGDVFAKMQENRAKDPYAGKDKTAYEKIEDYSANVQTPGSEAEDNGVTVTVSDAYCDGYEMYFTMTARGMRCRTLSGKSGGRKLCRSWTYQCRFSEEKGIFRSVNGKHTVYPALWKGRK